MGININGKAIADEYLLKLKNEIDEYKKNGQQITLAVLQVGDSSASTAYVERNAKSCNKVGIETEFVHLDKEVTTLDVVNAVKNLNNNPKINGIIVQLPLPKGVEQAVVTEAILPNKDVDGLTQANAGALYLGKKGFVPNTPMGVMTLLKLSGIEICGKRAVVIGRSNIVGKPMAMLLLQENATVTVCHSKTAEIAKVCSEADIIVCAIGKAHFLTADMVKEGAVIMDVGTNFINGKMTGDVDYENVVDKASYITPVPGGCGPMTVCMLIENTLRAAKLQNIK
ncbi:MAG: bifunctional 5,10-methylenetetrahydrofolate dehydrogenase/5,10-methenyltetrahydrofolate cyclohydrolase [Clostridia bacterium]